MASCLTKQVPAGGDALAGPPKWLLLVCLQGMSYGQNLTNKY